MRRLACSIVLASATAACGGPPAPASPLGPPPGPDKQPPWWYDTAIFQCGHPGPCEPDALRSWKEEVEGYARALRDPCGSTKVKRPQWETGVLPDGVHPDEFYASFALDVYPFI